MVRGLYGHPGCGKAWNKEKTKILLGLMFKWVGHQPPAPPAGHSSLPLALMRKRKYAVEWRSKACRYDATAFVFVRTDNNNETTRSVRGEAGTGIPGALIGQLLGTAVVTGRV